MELALALFQPCNYKLGPSRLYIELIVMMATYIFLCKVFSDCIIQQNENTLYNSLTNSG